MLLSFERLLLVLIFAQFSLNIEVAVIIISGPTVRSDLLRGAS